MASFPSGTITGRSAGEAVRIHFHEKRGAPLQIESQTNAPRGLALQPIQDITRRVRFDFSLIKWKKPSDIVCSDGLFQVLIRFIGCGLLQHHGLLDDRGKIGVASVDGFFAKYLHQVAAPGRIQFK